MQIRFSRVISVLAVVFGISGPAVAVEIKVYAGPSGAGVTSTMVMGEKDMVLIDTQFAKSDALRLAAEILETGKTLNTIYITHAHPDHFLGTEILARIFPDAGIVARPSVITEMAKTMPTVFARPGWYDGPNHLVSALRVPNALTGECS